MVASRALKRRRTDKSPKLDISFLPDAKKMFPSLSKHPEIIKELKAVRGSQHLSQREKCAALIGVLQRALYKAKTPKETMGMLQMMEQLIDEAIHMQSRSTFTIRRKNP